MVYLPWRASVCGEYRTYAGASCRSDTGGWPFTGHAGVHVSVDRLSFDDDVLRDVRFTGRAAGSEPLHAFESVVLRAFLSVYF